MRGRNQLMVVAGLLLALTACDRRGGLSGRFGELVVVQLEDSTEVLTREAEIEVAGAPMGESSTGTFVVRNVGDGPITLTKIRLDSGSTAFTIELPAQTQLGSTEETTFTVTFSPEQAADVSKATVAHRGSFVLESAGGRPGEETAVVTLRATAEARDCFVPPLLDFGEAPIGQAVVMPLTLSNLTGAPTQASVSGVAGPNPAFFSVEPGGTIEVAASTPLVGQIRFAPATEAEVRAQVTVRRRASCPEGTTQLVGRGSMQSLAWAPTEINFGRVPLNETATRVVTFSNRSGAAIPLAMRTTGDAFLVPETGATLPARGTVAVAVSCRPTALGAFTGTLHVDVGTSPVLPARVSLRCSGGGPRLRVTPNPLNLGVAPLINDAMGRPLSAASQTPLQRRLKLENVGTPPTTPTDTSFNLVLGRDGKVPFLSLTPLGRTQQGEFDVALIRSPPEGVPALVGRNAIDLDVKLTPTSVGLKEAVLTIYSNDGVQPIQEVRLQGSAQVAETCGQLLVMPNAAIFGDVPPNSVESQTLTITNPGTKACQVFGLEIAPGSDPGFVLATSQQGSFRIGPGASTTVQVRFDSTGLPTGITAIGFLRFSAPGTGTVSVPLSARVAQCLVFVPDEVDFGNIKEGCGSAPRTVQVFNQCGTPIRLNGASVAGAGFGIAQQPMIPSSGLVLAPSTGLTTISVAFRPPGLGTQLGTLTFTSTEGGSTRSLSVPLRGVGDTTGVTVETYDQPAQPQADILFTIDDSCSMFEEQQSLSQNFTAFISYATTANVDYQIAVTTTDDFRGQGAFVSGNGPSVLTRSTPGVQALFASRVNVGTGGSGEERPLSTTLKALTPPRTTTSNAGLIREEANLAVIIVTDAPDQSPEPIAYYTSRLPLVKGVRRAHQVSVSVIGPFRQASGTCFVEAPDPGRYRAVIMQTRGVEADICTSNWAMELQRLGESTLGPRSTFFVRNPPDTTQPIDVKVNGQAVSNAWNYNGATNSIIFQSGQAPGAGTRLTISYQSQCF